MRPASIGILVNKFEADAKAEPLAQAAHNLLRIAYAVANSSSGK